MRFRSSVQLAACVMALAMFAGCGSGSEKTAAEKPAETPAAEASHDNAAAPGHGMGEPGAHTPGAAVCPVSDHDVDPANAVMVTYEGREVQLCCADCVEPFNSDPAKYMAKLDAPEESHEGHNH